MVRRRWNEIKRFANAPFPGTKLDVLKFLHLQRKILFHGHEPLDTDTTPTLEGETWLLKHNFCQAEGMKNLDKVPEAGALILIGFAKPEGVRAGMRVTSRCVLQTGNTESPSWSCPAHLCLSNHIPTSGVPTAS